MHGYWTARGLAQRGHQVFVVTNANEVEPSFRLHLSKADLELGGEYAKVFADSAGSVKVYSTEPPESRLYYIPLNNPSVTRLATVATNLIRSEDCKVIFAYYLEPYCLSAYLASCWTGIPYVMKHAGSDLHNLALLDELQTAYLEVMHRANRILSSGPSRAKLLAYGIPEERIVTDLTFELPTNTFNPNAPSLDLPLFLKELRTEVPAERAIAPFLDPLESDLPILGIYGKLGEYKGSFDLLKAMAELIHDGFLFYLVAMSHGWAEPEFRRLIADLGIGKYVRILPFLPHWKVPGFIRSCTAVAFLERDFPITAHGPTIPSEVIACGTCAIVSEEIARKQPFRARMRNLQNIVIVPDPKEYKVLAECISYALKDQQRAAAIGRRGFDELGPVEAHEDYLDRFGSLLLKVSTEKPAEKQTHEVADVDDLGSKVPRLFPSTYSLMSAAQKDDKELLDLLDLEIGASSSRSLPLRLGARMLSFFDSDPATRLAPLREVCRYEYLLHEWREERDRNWPEAFSSIGFPLERAKLRPLYPTLKSSVKVVEFAHNVQAIIAAIQKGGTVPSESDPIKVLFRLSASPVRMNDSTARLLEILSGGSLNTERVLTMLSNHYQVNDEAARMQFEESVLDVLERFYWEGSVEFRENFRPQS